MIRAQPPLLVRSRHRHAFELSARLPPPDACRVQRRTSFAVIATDMIAFTSKPP